MEGKKWSVLKISTAQSISVIFAFITGIIKMARENRNANDDDAKLLSSEPYPLVMDAPLSAFDKRRITNFPNTSNHKAFNNFHQATPTPPQNLTKP